MVVRKRRRKNKYRGNRVHGKGDTKHKRGKGSKGGKGRAGSHKHRFTKWYMDFGHRVKLKTKKTLNAINIADLMQLLPRFLAEKKVEKEKDAFVVDGKKIGYDKILGKGIIKEKIIVRNMKVSENTAEKILKAGGKVEEKENSEKTGEKK